MRKERHKVTCTDRTSSWADFLWSVMTNKLNWVNLLGGQCTKRPDVLANKLNWMNVLGGQCAKRPVVVANKLNWMNVIGGQCAKRPFVVAETKKWVNVLGGQCAKRPNWVKNKANSPNVICSLIILMLCKKGRVILLSVLTGTKLSENLPYFLQELRKVITKPTARSTSPSKSNH